MLSDMHRTNVEYLIDGQEANLSVSKERRDVNDSGLPCGRAARVIAQAACSQLYQSRWLTKLVLRIRRPQLRVPE